MKVKLNLYFFVFLLLFILTKQIETYALVMIFAFIHELGHMICGMILGFELESLRIMPLGFGIEFKPIIQDYNKKILKSNIITVKKMIIALAGPLVNILIIIIGVIFNINSNVIYANLLLLIFNLLPIYPLDGGRILKNILKIFYGNKKANEYINLISNICFIIITMLFSVLILIYKNISMLAIIIILWCLILRENKKNFTYNKIYKIIDKTSN